MSVNKAILIGRLGKDPELKYTPSGTAVTNFTLATNERWKGQDGQSNEKTTWHNIIVWGKMAETVKEYLQKGREVYIEGRIQNRTYDDKDGNKRYISEVVAQTVQFLGGRGDSAGGAGSSVDSSQEAPAGAMEGESPADDDLPF